MYQGKKQVNTTSDEQLHMTYHTVTLFIEQKPGQNGEAMYEKGSTPLLLICLNSFKCNKPFLLVDMLLPFECSLTTLDHD